MNNTLKFIWILLVGNLMLIGLYFSGLHSLQQIIAPTIDGLIFSQWREFGLLEFIQNGLLLAINAVFLVAIIKRKPLIEKLFFAVGLAAFSFLFLEEIDYGLHYYEFFTGQSWTTGTRNWHNQWNDGVENATRLKKATDAVTALWFVLIPLLGLYKPIGQRLKTLNIVPSTWFISGFLVALMCSNLAHYLDDQGYATINGVPGNLTKTIAEFRETSIYYLYLLYAIQLIKTVPLFKTNKLT